MTGIRSGKAEVGFYISVDQLEEGMANILHDGVHIEVDAPFIRRGFRKKQKRKEFAKLNKEIVALRSKVSERLGSRP
ncbi:MAG: hypothetical protein CMI17_05045 [Opitutaceae bacterium]|nr:hypothetical protein [Opitutaceae bacterium]